MLLSLGTKPEACCNCPYTRVIGYHPTRNFAVPSKASIGPCLLVTGSNASEDLRPSKTVKAVFRNQFSMQGACGFHSERLKVSGFQPSTTLSRAGGTAADLTGVTWRQRSQLWASLDLALLPRSSQIFHIWLKIQRGSVLASGTKKDTIESEIMCRSTQSPSKTTEQ